MLPVENGPQRTCVACRETRDKKQLVRYVAAPDGILLVDYRQRLPGRGCYTCATLQCQRLAVKRKAFQRSFRNVDVKAEAALLEEQLLQAVRQKIASLIGMARKSGQMASGSQAVIDILRGNTRVAVVLLAEDVSQAIGDKVHTLSVRNKVWCSRLFNKQVIGQLLGKEERSAVAVTSGSLAEALLFELQRYEQLLREN